MKEPKRSAWVRIVYGRVGLCKSKATGSGSCLGEAAEGGEQRGAGNWVRTGVFGATELALT